MSIELCEICEQPTGGAGRSEDSIVCGVCDRTICEKCVGEYYTAVDDDYPVCKECKEKRM